jgi:hypothetical protein
MGVDHRRPRGAEIGCASTNRLQGGSSIDDRRQRKRTSVGCVARLPGAEVARNCSSRSERAKKKNISESGKDDETLQDKMGRRAKTR